MIPIADLKESKHAKPSSSPSSEPDPRFFAWVTIALVAVNLVVFIIETQLSQTAITCFAYAYSFTPDAVQQMVHHGLTAAPSVTPGCQNSAFVPPPTIISLFTALFIHASILHIAGNMIFLLVFGGGVESRLGHGRFLLFYLACGIVASLVETFALVEAVSLFHVSPNVLTLPNIGASGAIAGVMGAYLVYYPRRRILTVIPLGLVFLFPIVPASIVILVWFVLQVFDGVAALTPAYAAAQGGVAYFAHIGGFLMGALVAIAVRGIRAQKNMQPISTPPTISQS